MLREFKYLGGNTGKSNDVEEIENVPINPNELNSTRVDQEISGKSKFIRTPTKSKGKNSDNGALPLRNPEGQLNAAKVGKNRLGFSSLNEGCGEGRSEMANYLSQSSRYGSSLNLTPRVDGGVVRGGATISTHSECSSTQSTPTKSVSKPPNPGFAPFSSSRHHGSGRGGNYGALSRRFSVSSCPPCIVNTVEVPHFDLKEDPSFWMDHNVQVILRARPLNNFEINTNGYNRCVNQDSAQSITWVGQPETRFTFDHVACETVDQEMLFRMAGLPMVENCLSGYNSCMFAYGQTGSGKTFTMLGEIEDLEFKPSPHRGMTPRIFEFLFARIRAEEESRRDEKLKYSCKCSFLEIYNEQITDLLDPSSSNLLLREDVKKGVHVENLSEFEVHTVGDVLRLLVHGSSNRKVAATNMNRESSRSHSVFTCIIESKWERDLTTNLRFARLNLVDLAGSERQKSSGAEGERLKEAANINKSLSTLGHVIMLLVDIAHGKPRHVPYRDSRLTFLLQDSLGGNSKTMIIANISPSICSAAETLNTLKFAQRAKLIQNNAMVNEDSSGDVAVLQHQICLLKEELSALRRQSVSRNLAFDHPPTVADQGNIDTEANPQSDELQTDKVGESDSEDCPRVSYKQLKTVESMLAGALRREQMAETNLRQLEAEIEQLNRLVRQREEDTQCTKMMLKFREDKIQRMESLLGDLKPVDSYLDEENTALVEEVQLLQAKVEKNPEVTRFALENIRLLEQLRKFQDFYEEGERDILMNEVSELRAQLIRYLEYCNQKSSHQHSDPDEPFNIEENQSLRSELTNTMNELTGCRSKLKSCIDSNAKLNREIEELQSLLRNKEPEIYNHQDVHQVKEVVHPSVGAQAVDAAQEVKCKIYQGNLLSHEEEIVNMELDLDILRIILKEERLSHKRTEEMEASLTRDVQLANDKLILISKQFEDARKDMQEAQAVIEALESQQLLSINEIEDLKNLNSHYQKVLRKKEHEISALKEQTHGQECAYSCSKCSECEDSVLQTQLKKMQASLDKAKRLNMSFQRDHVSQKSNEEEMDESRRQARAETAEVIVSFQEELCMLQQQVHESELREKEKENRQKELQETIDMMSQENEALHRCLLEKNAELKSSNIDWELLSCEIEENLVKGCEALESASDQLDSISTTFSNRNGWISRQFGKLLRLISEKESIIAELNHSLEDANCRTMDLEHMLFSLRGATMVVTESHQQECFEKEQEIILLKLELSRKVSDISKLEDRVKLGQDQLSRISDCATTAFLVVNRLSEINSCHLDTLRAMDTQVRQLQTSDEERDGFLQEKATAHQEAWAQNDSLGKELVISDGNCTRLTHQLNEQQKGVSIMQRKQEENDERAIENTEKVLNDLKMGVSGLRSSMNQYVEEVGHPQRHSPTNLGVDHVSLEQNGVQTINEIKKAASCSAEGLEAGVPSTAQNTNLKGQKDLPLSLYNNSDSLTSCCSTGVSNSTIILLRKELESAMESLKEVQEEIVFLSAEKEEIRKSEKNGEEIEIVKAVLLNLEVAFSDFEKQCETKISALSHKLQRAEEYAEEAKSSWWKTRESLELELVNVEATAAQKEVEASCFLARFEEVQDTIQEADIMINGLMIANENLKLEFEDLKRRNAVLMGERDNLSNEVNGLRSSKELKDTMCKNLEEQFESSISEMMSHVEELEKLVLLVLETSEENFVYLAKDFKRIKSQLQDTVKLVHSPLHELKIQNSADLPATETQHKSSLGYIDELKSHNCMLRGNILTLESKVASLQNNLETKTEGIDDIICSRLSSDEELCNKGQELESYAIKVSEMLKENLILRDQLRSLKQRDAKALGMSSSKVANCVRSVETAEQKSNWMLKHLDENIITVLDHMSEDACLNLDLLSKLLKELEFLDSAAKDLVSENKSLQEDLFRKDEVLNGLLFDLRLLQESAANSKDQKDATDELTASLESTEHELAVRSQEYDEVVAYNDTLEVNLKEREDVISELEADLQEANRSVKILSDEIGFLRSRVEDTMLEKSSVSRELSETRCVLDRLENELLEMGNTLCQMNELTESLKGNLDEVCNERDNLQNELLISREKVETAHALAEENEAIAAEAQEISESRRIYAEEKEEEVKLLESSVQELDSTISVLENKVELLNGEAERQRLQREELELELQSLKIQMHNIENTDADVKKHLDEKARNLKEALKRIKVLEKELANKDTEIAECKTFISELTVHAEAQACENKNKFKELEAMVGQVKAEEASSHDKISSSNKLEKNASKGRGSASPFKAKGSGSPFKCIGIGLSHQFKSEKDEEITAERRRIEDLEALAASRQKEIFMLNARLAATESMTHDVIRDLLGVRLDMSNYVKLLDKQQVQKIIEKAQLDSFEPQNEEVKHLKRQLNEFIEERRGWLEEVDRRQAELVTAQDALENHRQEQQMLIAENDLLKKRVEELEGEVKKLSGQQNLHQRIHHHAKIKEENNVLKTQKEDLTFRLRRTESYLARVKEELVYYRACHGRDPCIDFDLEQRLDNKLKEVEEENVHLAHTLLGLCTRILQAAGITRPASEIHVSVAEEALEQLSSRVVSLEREVDDLHFKHKITHERIRLAELMPPDSSPFSTRSEDSRQMPRRAAIDR